MSASKPVGVPQCVQCTVSRWWLDGRKAERLSISVYQLPTGLPRSLRPRSTFCRCRGCRSPAFRGRPVPGRPRGPPPRCCRRARPRPPLGKSRGCSRRVPPPQGPPALMSPPTLPTPTASTMLPTPRRFRFFFYVVLFFASLSLPPCSVPLLIHPFKHGPALRLSAAFSTLSLVVKLVNWLR